MQQASINFFSTKNSIPKSLQTVEPYLMPVGMILGGITVCAAVALAAVYLTFLTTKSSLEKQKAQAIEYLRTNQQKEQTFAFIRSRLVAISAIRKTQKSFAPYVDTALAIAPSPRLSSFGLDEKNNVRLQVVFTSVEDGESTLKNINDLLSKRKIYGPTISGIDINNDGRIVMSLTYGVVGLDL